MPSIDLVIVVLRILNYKYENFYSVRKHLDIAFSGLSALSNQEQIEHAIENIHNDFFEGSSFDKEFIKQEIVVIVTRHLKRK